MNEALQNSRQIRVFISSTFRDMQAERDYLVKFIFPQLRKLCESRGVTWGEVDLRWGVTDEQAAEGKVLPICLEEIKRCRPYFIGLLGERYGWIPDAIPTDVIEREPWLKEHLHGRKSVTELEIIHGVLRDEEMHGHAYFYFRDPKYFERVPKERQSDFTTENAKSAEKLERLKKEIRRARDEQVCRVRENFSDPEKLGEWILEDFTKLIKQLYPKDQTPDPLCQEAARHEAYARSRRLAFVRREDLLRCLNEHCAASSQPLVLTGESGCGKSALLADWVARWRNDHPDDLIIQHYIGSTPDSASWQGLVCRILGELKHAFSIADGIPSNTDALRTALQDWTTKSADPHRRVVLVLDALNQLADDNAARQLGWLPAVFPPNFRVIISTLPGESIGVVKRREWKLKTVGLFDDTKDRTKLLWRFLRYYRKRLNKQRRRRIAAADQSANPLFLHALLDEMRQFGEHQKLDERIDYYLSAPDLPELFDRILSRWHEDFGKDPEHPNLVRRALCLISCARFGLLESELLDLLGKNDERLPGRYWTPFYLAAEGALTLRAGLLNFGHDYLRAAVRKRWLENAETVQTFRLQLADYFGKQSEMTRRKADEWPWQLLQAERQSDLAEVLCHVRLVQALASLAYGDILDYWKCLSPTVNMVNAYEEAWSLAGGTRNNDASPIVTDFANTIGRLLEDSGHWNAAAAFYGRFLERRTHEHNSEGLSVQLARRNYAACLSRLGRYSEAEPLLRTALNDLAQLLGYHDPITLEAATDLAAVLRRRGSSNDINEAQNLHNWALHASLFGGVSSKPAALHALAFATFLKETDRKDEALKLAREAADSLVTILGPRASDVLLAKLEVGEIQCENCDHNDGLVALEQVADDLVKVLGVEHPHAKRAREILMKWKATVSDGQHDNKGN